MRAAEHAAGNGRVQTLPRFFYMLIDTDGQRIGRYETSRLQWAVGDTFEFEEQPWVIVEMLPEVSTAVAYHGLWVVAPA